MKISIYTLFLYSFLGGRSVFAAGEVLNWEACVREASKRNAELIASQDALDRARSQARSKLGPFLPSLAGSLGYTYTDTQTSTPSLTGSASGDSYSASLNLSQNIFNGFKDSAALEQANAAVESAQAAVQLQKSKLHFDLKKAFTQVVFSDQMLLLARNVAKRRKENLDLVDLRFNGGRENKGSYLRSKANYRSAQFEISQQERNLKSAKVQLLRLLGRDPDVEVLVEGTLATKPFESGVDLKTLTETHPAVRQAAADLSASEQGVSRAYGAFWPSLNLSASLSRQGSQFPPDTNRWSVGATLVIPLFNWSDLTEVASAKAEEHRGESNLRNSREQTRAKLEDAFATLENALERVEVQKEIISAASVRAEIARGQYTSGLASYNDWDLIESDLINQQQSLLAIQRDSVGAEAAWEQAMGRGDIP